MDYSIGGYHIKDYKKGNKDEFVAELYKYDTKIARVENMGDDFVDIEFAPIETIGKSDYNFILDDMYNLLLELTPILEEDARHKQFTHSAYSATLGFVQLLIHFGGIIEQYNEIPKKDESPNYYIVGACGSSFFTNKSSDIEPNFFRAYALSENYNSAEKMLTEFSERHKAERGDLVAGAVLVGEMDWNLTFEDFGELYNP